MLAPPPEPSGPQGRRRSSGGGPVRGVIAVSRIRALAHRGASRARRLGLVSSPLRRGTDRFEGWLRVGLVLAFMIAAPLGALGAGQWTSATMTRTAQAQASDYHYVTATLISSAPQVTADTARGTVSWVRARWTAPDGSPRTGEIQAPAGAPAHSTVRVWIDGTGKLTAAPITHAQITGRVITAAILTVVTLLLLLIVVLAVVHRLLERRRMSDWEQSWSAVEPLWTRRLR